MNETTPPVQPRPVFATYLDLAPSEPNGETIVLLHGSGFSSAYWYQTARALQRDGYRVVVPEQFCLDASSEPEEIGPLFARLANETRALLRSLGVSRAHLLGHSHGGRLAIRYALMFPGETQSLLLLDPDGRADGRGSGWPHSTIDGWRERLLRLTPETVREYRLQSGAGRRTGPPPALSRQSVWWNATTASG